MKILLVGKSRNTGGAAIASRRLMEALMEKSAEVKMLVQEGESKSDGVFSTTRSRGKRLLNKGRFILERLVFLPRERNKNIRFLFSLANTGENLANHPLVKEADIIHLHWINAGFLSLRSLKALLNLGKPVVWTFHDMWPFTGGCHYALDCMGYTLECGHCPYLRRPGANDLSHRIWLKKKEIFSTGKFTVITPSRWLKERVRASSLLANADVRTIHNPVDSFLFQPADRERACRSLNLDPGKKYILFGAATTKNVLKGYSFFKEAVGRLAGVADPAQVEIILFGRNKGRDQHAWPLPARHVDFVGSSERLVELYSVAHLFVIPSLQDNLPNTILESMLCGTPVVGFNTGGIPELIDHRQNGYLADFKSPDDLAQGMQWILSLEDYDRFSKETRERTMQRYSKMDAVEAHLQLYSSLLNQPHAS
jgi:glycosyltransferase involved in cell wall biosynthesis